MPGSKGKRGKGKKTHSKKLVQTYTSDAPTVTKSKKRKAEEGFTTSELKSKKHQRLTTDEKIQNEKNRDRRIELRTELALIIARTANLELEKESIRKKKLKVNAEEGELDDEHAKLLKERDRWIKILKAANHEDVEMVDAESDVEMEE